MMVEVEMATHLSPPSNDFLPTANERLCVPLEQKKTRKEKKGTRKRGRGKRDAKEHTRETEFWLHVHYEHHIAFLEQFEQELRCGQRGLRAIHSEQITHFTTSPLVVRRNSQSVSQTAPPACVEFQPTNQKFARVCRGWRWYPRWL